MYETFKRSARNWTEFAQAEKTVVETGLTYSEAQDACRDFNDNRTDEEKAQGTKLEFTAE